jgi:hypothetical protein
MPVYTPVLLSLVDREMAALTIRVDDLSSFRKPKVLITVKFVAHRSKQGTWVVCVAFRVADNPQDPLEGDAYLNPRQAGDYECLLEMSRQGIFPLVFMSRDLRDAVGKWLPWRDAQREEVFRAIMTMRKDLTGEKLGGVFDPDFEQAKREFQSRHTVTDLLSQ